MVDELLNTGNILDMSSINTMYNNLLGKEKPENFKRYLKTLLEENVKNIVFNQPLARNQPERLFVQYFCKRQDPETSKMAFGGNVPRIYDSIRIAVFVSLDNHCAKTHAGRQL